MGAPNVRFCRPMMVGVAGADVRGHKRAVSRACPDLYPWMEFTDYFGKRFEKAVQGFQRDHGIQATGKIGRATHEALERAHAHGSKTEWAFQRYEVELIEAFCEDYVKTPEERVREAVVAAGRFWLAHALEIRYSQFRPFELGKPPWVPARWDCSAFVTNCHYAGGAKDPNNRGYDHQGYTGTLMDTGVVVGDFHDLDPGDLIFYGYTTHETPAFPKGSPTHVALYEGFVSGVPCVISNGSYPMARRVFDYRRINHLRHYDLRPAA